MEEQGEIGVRCGEDFVTYPELFAAALRATTGLAGLGVGAGDRVALLLRNSIEFLQASIATVPLGASAVPINWHWRAQEIAHVLADSGAKVLVAHAGLWAALQQSLPQDVSLVLVRDDRDELPAPHPGALAWADWMATLEPWGEEPQTAPVSIIYTSGTTGKPKGVVRVPRPRSSGRRPGRCWPRSSSWGRASER